jgi:hypothetical protein
MPGSPRLVPVEPVRCPESTEPVAIELPLEPQSAGRARSAIASLRPSLDASSFDEMRLLVSELVADAIAAESPPQDAAVSLRAQVMDDVTRVAVRFEGLAMRIRPRKPELGDPGWGLYLVQRLAARWGARHDDESTSVWFEVPSRGIQVTTAAAAPTPR